MATKSIITAADPRFLKEEGFEVYTGNEAIVKGLLETDGGVHLLTGYPGSPISGIFDSVQSIAGLLKEHGIQAILANNEALAAAMLNGSQMAGLRAVAAMKSVGFHVASDGLALGNLCGSHPEGGAIVIIGDDPWNDSTQAPADSRFLCKHLHMPLLEPSTIQEMKDWINLGFLLSRHSNLFIGYLVTTNQADGGGTVSVKKNHFPIHNALNPFLLNSSEIDLENRVILPPRTSKREQDYLFRYRLLWSKAKELGIDKSEFLDQKKGRKKIGFISSGLVYCYLVQALSTLGMYGQIPILKLGLSYPLNPEVIIPFAEAVEELYVIEERRAFVEENLVLLFSQEGITKKVYGKKFPFGLQGIPSTGGLDPSILIQLLNPLFSKVSISNERTSSFRGFSLENNSRASFNLPLRTPTFCPGCPHRDSAAVLLEIQKDFKNPHYMKSRYQSDPIELVFHGDTGCYTMLMFEPFQNLMHNYSGMGLGGGTGLGIDPFIKNKQVVFMGDSTFFHSGMIAISNSVKNGQDITYIILDNRTTAMTGHQTTPALDKDLLGERTDSQDIEKIIASVTEKTGVPIYRLNPASRESYKMLLERTLLKDGVKVVIAEKECAIVSHRRQTSRERQELREKGYIPKKRYVFINPDVCEFCLECTLSTGCPGLTFVETDFGKKMATDLSWCIADGACARVGACPAFEELTVYRSSPRSTSKKENLKLDLPPRENLTKPFRIVVAGVGGMGIASVTAVLVRAGHREGYGVQFCDRNGLAIRNGSVVSQIVFYPKSEGDNPPITAIGNYGDADLILGLDPLETARIIDPVGRYRVASPEKTSLILNETITQTVRSLLGKDQLRFEQLEEKILSMINPKKYLKFPFSRLSEEYFDNKLYSNLMVVGVAFQAGLLPFSLESIEWAVQETLGKTSPINFEAFSVGRALATGSIEREKPTEQVPIQDYHQEWDAFINQLQKSKKEEAQKLWKWNSEISSYPLDTPTIRAFSVRLKNLYLYEDINYAQLYFDAIQSILIKDEAQFQFAATKAAIENIYKCMAIKDEVEVARLLTEPQTLSQDLQKLHIHFDKGDKVVYKHWTCPEFVIGKLRIRFRLKSSQWMLQLMKRAKFLRRLLPGWHAKERAFRDWFLSLCKGFDYSTVQEYQLWVEILKLPEEIKGYREIRYPKMEAARDKASKIMAAISSNSQKEQRLLS
jgi:indolepyruvate ferredoxin oxidoreductase